MDRILVLLYHPGNRRLLSEWLGQYYDVRAPDTQQNIDAPCDLVIVDGMAVEQYSQAVQAKKHRDAPAFLPCLLLAPRQQAVRVKRHLGKTADELLWTPIDKDELQTRVTILLRGRQQSLELKRHNDELEALLDARKAVERMKDEFIAIASHELRSPLNAIHLYLSMLLDEDAGKLTAEQEQFLRVIEDNADRLTHLANDVLDISRMASGRLPLNIEPVDLREMIEQACAELHILGSSKRIQTQVTLPSTPVAVRADAHRLMQIFTNLLSNAYKYSSEDTVVTVQVSRRDQVAQIEVIDQGMGIAEADQNQLFTMFFRAEAVRNSHVRGAGLGLYITRMLLEMQNGQIGVNSCPGKGSTFSCTLPLAVAPPSEVTGSPLTAPPGDRGKL
jgi:signal transduction histidine kinase